MLLGADSALRPGAGRWLDDARARGGTIVVGRSDDVQRRPRLEVGEASDGIALDTVLELESGHVVAPRSAWMRAWRELYRGCRNVTADSEVCAALAWEVVSSSRRVSRLNERIVWHPVRKHSAAVLSVNAEYWRKVLRRCGLDDNDRLLADWAHRLLVPSLRTAAQTDESTVLALFDLARGALPPSPEHAMWAHLACVDRCIAWAGAVGDAVMLRELVGSEFEDSPTALLDGEPLPGVHDSQAVPPVDCAVLPSAVRAGVPDALMRIGYGDLVPRIYTPSVSEQADDHGRHVARVSGAVYVPGTSACRADALEVVGGSGQVIVSTPVQRARSAQVDVAACDPWLSHVDGGFHGDVDMTALFQAHRAGAAHGAPGDVAFRVRTSGRDGSGSVWLGRADISDGVSTRIAPSVNTRHSGHVPEVASLHQAALKGRHLWLAGSFTGQADPSGRWEVLFSSSVSSFRVPLTWDTSAHRDHLRWEATADVVANNGVAVERRDYGVEVVAPDGVRFPVIPFPSPDGVLRCLDRGVDPGVELEGSERSVRIRRDDGTLVVGFIVPVSPHDRSLHGQRAARVAAASRLEESGLRHAVLFESFRGRSIADNPGSIFANLRRVISASRDPELKATELIWSVEDGALSVPDGAERVVTGSSEWVDALMRARVIVTNDNLPWWYRKSESQFLVQTWHGTPIKKLLRDAPDAVSLQYRRLMERQVPMWDLLLAQNCDAERDLRSAFGYGGRVLVGEYPRNVALGGGSLERGRVRASLGAQGDVHVVLYAPTWRQYLRGSGGAAGGLEDLLDAEELAERTNSIVLFRSHHMNGMRGQGNRVVDVSRYPRVEELMLASDVLISDYSSILVDWRLTGRPGIVYVPDLESYMSGERGFYYDWPRCAPYPVCSDGESLALMVSSALDGSDARFRPVDMSDARATCNAVVQLICSSLTGNTPVAGTVY